MSSLLSPRVLLQRLHSQSGDPFFFGKCLYMFSSVLYVYVMPFVQLYYYLSDNYPRARAAFVAYRSRYWAAPSEGKALQTTPKVGPESQSMLMFATLYPKLIVVDEYGNRTGMSYVDAYMRCIHQRDIMSRLYNEIGNIKVLCEDLLDVRGILGLTLFLLALRTIYLCIR